MSEYGYIYVDTVPEAFLGRVMGVGWYLSSYPDNHTRYVLLTRHDGIGQSSMTFRPDDARRLADALLECANAVESFEVPE